MYVLAIMFITTILSKLQLSSTRFTQCFALLLCISCPISRTMLWHVFNWWYRWHVYTYIERLLKEVLVFEILILSWNNDIAISMGQEACCSANTISRLRKSMYLFKIVYMYIYLCRLLHLVVIYSCPRGGYLVTHGKWNFIFVFKSVSFEW